MEKVRENLLLFVAIFRQTGHNFFGTPCIYIYIDIYTYIYIYIHTYTYTYYINTYIFSQKLILKDVLK